MKLSPCPQCGHTHLARAGWTIWCKACQYSITSSSREAAIKVWNGGMIVRSEVKTQARQHTHKYD